MSRQERLAPSQYGIFADSEALGHLDEMDEEQDPESYKMTRPCEGCSQMQQCQIAWSELYCLQYGLDPNSVGKAIGREDLFPSRWVYEPSLQCFHPGYRHNCMGNPLVVFNMTPIEAERKLHSAGRNGVISDVQQNIIRTIAPVVKQMSGARPGVSPQQAQQLQQRAMMQQQGRR